jgi:hypothetical protein
MVIHFIVIHFIFIKHFLLLGFLSDCWISSGIVGKKPNQIFLMNLRNIEGKREHAENAQTVCWQKISHCGVAKFKQIPEN